MDKLGDKRRASYLKTFVVFGVIILLVLITSSTAMYVKLMSVSNDVQNKIDEANKLISEVNKNIDEIKSVNAQIQQLQDQNNLISLKLENLSKKYPPSQTLNFNNINQNDLNNAISSEIEVKFNEVKNIIQFNFWFNIAIGSILSLGGISFLFYFIFKRRGKND